MPLAPASRRAHELSNSPLIGRGAHGNTSGLQSTTVSRDAHAFLRRRSDIDTKERAPNSSLNVATSMRSAPLVIAAIAAASRTRQMRTVTPSVSERIRCRIFGWHRSDGKRSGRIGRECLQ